MRIFRPSIVPLLLTLAACLAMPRFSSAQIDDAMLMTLTSSELSDGAAMPDDYTCKGFDASPPLTVGRLPADTKAVALVMEDLDGMDGERAHWVVVNIRPDDAEFERGSIPVGAVAAKNDFGKAGYTGPCPKAGVHRYQFTAYALQKKLDLPADADAGAVMEAMKGNVLKSATLTATFAADAE